MKIQWLLVVGLLFACGCDNATENNVTQKKVEPTRPVSEPSTEKKIGSDMGAVILQKVVPSPPPSIGDDVREIAGADLDGVNFKLSDYQGKVIVLGFWGDWNPSCHKLYPQGRSLVKQLADQPFAFIGVNSDGDINRIRKVVQQQELPWRNFQDRRSAKGPISKQWGVSEWPTIYVIDAKGKIRFHNVQGKELDQAVESLLKEAGIEVTISHPADSNGSKKDDVDNGKADQSDGKDS